MNVHNEVTTSLQEIVSSSDFPDRSEDVVDKWISEDMGVEAVNSILNFMEDNSDIDYGAPGALVHFLERFYLHGYEGELISSIRRKPTLHTVWMLNRLINGTKSPDLRSSYIDELRKAKSNPQLSKATLTRIDHFLSKL